MAKKDEWLGDVQLDEDEGEDDGQDWGDWNADQEEEGDDLDSNILCLFCCSIFNSSSALFHHCRSIHYFDFRAITKTLALDFYASFNLINYVRSQVAENRCWSCRHTCQSKQDLQNHLHETFSLEDTIFPWADDKYLKPFMQEDPLLYSFGEDYESEDEDTTAVNKISDLVNCERICMEDDSSLEEHLYDFNTQEDGRKEIASTSNCCLNVANPSEVMVDGVDVKEDCCSSHGKSKDKHWEICSAKAAVTNEIKNVNKNYFGSYSSFAIHREMISDKVRTDAYRQAILNNPSLLHGAAVLDVGCGTGILSLFAAQAGASSVIAVEASEKMASVATEIAKNNGLLWSGSPNNRISQCTGVIRVVQGMVEELDNSIDIQPHSIDVLLSEWMGYCLLYESMLSSVLFVRDLWLKPGGAIIPDTATMFVAGFGRGGTSIPFWENVYGFNMSCIGKELVEDAAGVPFVDVVDSQDIVTNTVVLQSFDLLKMMPDEMDFSSRIELEPQLDNPTNCTRDSFSKTTWCYGVVLWFETGFTSRFCKEMPIVLSTSPYAPKTHWSQTILTFKEPIAIASALAKPDFDRLAAVGTESCPAVKIHSRISIARAASQHRCIDISLEIAVIGPDGLKRSWPAQIFNLA
ncbi:Protein arginine N-methyltransferase [Actinidia chinensis var. chinensis]|uniref:Protein arginine N-methyltransferase n=1 Tax=Actinidia chinensis var. chinensis TaxID=1590841 RepID=A0A2R6R149_ACTCC|nr:Protein arginine N-methyltransferase [Actinidia chinensis var. chinensis]